MPAARVLALADLHLGRRPSRLPAGVDREALSTAAVWERAVDHALAEGVGLVLLGGDLIHRPNRYFEAFGPLERGITRLAAGGVTVCAVAGNHDYDLLDGLAETTGAGAFHLLGARAAGGRWQRFTWRDADGRSRLHVDGWSFPSRDVEEDPVAAYDLAPPADGTPVVGLVHGELGAARGTNGPIAPASIEGTATAGWVIGHVHKPALVDLAGGRWALAPGSPQPLDPTETGVHGAWSFAVEDGRVSRPEPLALASLRYEPVAVDLSDVDRLDEVRHRLALGARQRAEAIAAGPGGDRLVQLLLRLTLTGRTRVHGDLAAVARDAAGDGGLSLAGGLPADVIEVAVATRPAIDLAARARGDDPVGALAGLLLALEAGEGGGGLSEEAARLPADLLRDAVERTRQVREQRQFLDLGAGDAPGTVAVRGRLERVAASLLDTLLAQKDDREELAVAAAGAGEEAAAGDEAGAGDEGVAG